MIDDRLSEMLKTRIHYQKKIVDDAFREAAILGSFASRVALAFMMGVISLETHADLERVRKVRNAFAHRIGMHTFDSQPACDHVDGMTMPERQIVLQEPGVEWHLNPEPWEPENRRERFIRTVQLLNAAFYFQIYRAKDQLALPRF